MTNYTQLMKSVIRNKQQSPAAGPEERTSQAISHTSRFPFIFFHFCFPREEDAQSNTPWLWLPEGISNSSCVSDEEHT